MATLLTDINNQANRITAVINQELSEGGKDNAIGQTTFTGNIRIYDDRVWFEFNTPGSWSGRTWFTGEKTRGVLVHIEADDFDS